MVDVLFVASNRYWNRPASPLRTMMTTTSDPPSAVSPPMTPPKRNPASAASRISFCIVDVLLVASTRYSTGLWAAAISGVTPAHRLRHTAAAIARTFISDLDCWGRLDSTTTQGDRGFVVRG